MKQRRALLIAIVIVAVIGAIWSYVLLATPQESLDQRVHDVASQLKCPVCEGESVADSPSTISLQMRGVIRQQLQQGKSEQQIIQYFVSRYGNTILWSPPKQGFTLLAWVIPIAILLCGAILLLLVMRGWLAGAHAARPSEDANTIAQAEQDDLEHFQAQLEQELASDDPMFARLSHEEARATPTTHEVQRPVRQGKGDPRGRPGNVGKEVSS